MKLSRQRLSAALVLGIALVRGWFAYATALGDLRQELKWID